MRSTCIIAQLSTYLHAARNEKVGRSSAVHLGAPRRSDHPVVVRAPTDDVAHEFLESSAPLLYMCCPVRPKVPALRNLTRHHPNREERVPRLMLVDRARLDAKNHLHRAPQEREGAHLLVLDGASLPRRSPLGVQQADRLPSIQTELDYVRMTTVPDFPSCSESSAGETAGTSLSTPSAGVGAATAADGGERGQLRWLRQLKARSWRCNPPFVSLRERRNQRGNMCVARSGTCSRLASSERPST
jgi:hypothetical protein